MNYTPDEIAEMVRTAVEAERERCARVCESFGGNGQGYIDDDWAQMCADAIRDGRAQQPPDAEVRALPAKWRDRAANNPGSFAAAANVVCADELEAALAAEGVQAGEVASWQRSIELRPGHWGEWAEYTDIYGEGRPEKVGRFNCRYRPLYTASALSQQPAPSTPVEVEDGPIDASDNAEYIEHCADRLERCGLPVTAGALRVIAHEHRTLAQRPAAVVDGWRLVIRYGEYDNEPGVWAEKDDSFVWIANFTGESNG